MLSKGYVSISYWDLLVKVEFEIFVHWWGVSIEDSCVEVLLKDVGVYFICLCFFSIRFLHLHHVCFSVVSGG